VSILLWGGKVALGNCSGEMLWGDALGREVTLGRGNIALGGNCSVA